LLLVALFVELGLHRVKELTIEDGGLLAGKTAGAIERSRREFANYDEYPPHPPHEAPRVYHTARGAAVAWPLAARAQQADRVRRIGVLNPFVEKREGPETDIY
jgi:hypothetical protein